MYRTWSLAGLIVILCGLAAPQPAQAQDAASQAQKEITATNTESEVWQAVAAFIHPEFVLYQADSLPFGGVWRGPDGFKAWMKAMAGNFTSFGGRDPRIIVEGDMVIIVLTLVGETRKTGQHFEMPIAQVIKIRNGRLLEVRPFYWDTAATSAALGHNPEQPSL